MKKLSRLNYQQNTKNIYTPLIELKRWGRYLNQRIYPDKQPASLFGTIADYGIHLGPVQYLEATLPDPTLKQTQRVWAFMPEPIKQAIFLFYAMDGELSFKARRMKVPRGMFLKWIGIGEDFYLQYRDTDFSAFDVDL